MRGWPRLGLRALAALATSQGAFVVLALGHASGFAAPFYVASSVAALVAATIGAVVRDSRALIAAGGFGVLGSAVVVSQPMPTQVRILAVVGAVGLVAFMEIAHLDHRTRTAWASTDPTTVQAAWRRLRATLATTLAATLVVAAVPWWLGPIVDKTSAMSVELQSTWAMTYGALVVGLVILTVGTVRRRPRGRPHRESKEP